MDEGRAKHTKAKWSNNFYEENNTIYYLYLKEPKKIFDDRFQIRAVVYLSDIKDEVAEFESSIHRALIFQEDNFVVPINSKNHLINFKIWIA